MRKRLIALIMMFVVIFSMSTIANAAFFASEYISDVYAYAGVSSNGRVTVNRYNGRFGSEDYYYPRTGAGF